MLLVLYGKSGSGKDYLAKKLTQDFSNYYQVKRPTTRPKRSEREVDYYRFYTENGYQEALKADEILFTWNFRGWDYGIYRGISAQARDKEDCYVLTIDKNSAFEVAEYVKQFGGLAYIVEVNAPEKIRKNRILKREVSPDTKEVDRRLKSDKEDYDNNTNIPNYYFSSYDDSINFQSNLDSLKLQLNILLDKFKKGEVK